MKQFRIILVAMAVAIGFSAFTTRPQGVSVVYLDDFNEYQPYTGNIEAECPEGDDEDCVLFIEGENRQLFYAAPPHAPYQYEKGTK